MKVSTLKDLDGLKKKGLKTLYPEKPRILVGAATCGIVKGSLEVVLDLAYRAQQEGTDVEVARTGCLGFCQMEPLVDVWVPGEPRVVYKNITTDETGELFEAIKNGRVYERRALLRIEGEYLVLKDEEVKYELASTNGKYDAVPLVGDVAFYKNQFKIATRNCGFIKPTSLEEYVARGGLYPLFKVLTKMKPDEVIDAVTKSGLRGRGGAGFPTGRKWRIVRDAPSDVKYIVCNAEEGDPGAYMDRNIVEGDPYSVLESMIICAYAVGNVQDGYVYLRHAYSHARFAVEEAIDTLREYGLLGDDIMGTGLKFTIQLARDPGAFVCGEETGLIKSIEGRRGMPRFRPPYPAVRGLWGRPTCINNVETYANVPWIIRNGPEAFATMGTEQSRGTKVFALAGRVRRGGLIEVPMGITIREIVEEIGGGIRDDRRFKAVQIGGPSGGCVPARLADSPIDYQALLDLGAMMGSGGLVVLDDRACMVDMARYFLEFTQAESCGRCTFCRIGTKRMLEILERLCAGQGEKGDIEKLEHLADRVRRTSLCGLGRTAPNPVLTTLRYFREEYEAHIAGRCLTGSCRALIRYVISDECFGCTICAQNCPVSAIEARPYEQHEINAEVCVRCGLCASLCPVDAIHWE